MEKGYLAIILHAHLPFVKHPKHEHVLEENWLKEAVVESYIPLLMMLDDLINEGVDFRVTLSVTPTLATMLLDPLLKNRFLASLERTMTLGEQEVTRTKSDPAIHALACLYRDNLKKIHHAYTNTYKGDLVEAFRQLQGSGKVEILASAATHGYLPLLSTDPGAVHAQVQIGIDTYRHLFGQAPKGFWLPECGYAPGLDDVLAEHGIRYTVLETHGITRADEKPMYGVYAPIRCPSDLAVFGRDPETSKQVWSATEGYPGDVNYREFYRDIGYDLPLDYLKPFIHPEGIRADTGFKYFRVTGSHEKDVYNPQKAHEKVEIHANRFLLDREKRVAQLAPVMDRKPLFVAPYDAELFGHWWFEGPRWLDTLIRKMDSHEGATRLITLSEYLDEFPVQQTASPCASSWGAKGYHETWLNKKNDWIYPQLHKGALTMKRLASQYSHANGLTSRSLKQAARELLLAQASDWAFMMHSGSMADYGRRRTTDHVDRLNRMAWDVEYGGIDEQWLHEIEAQDNIFPEMDYRLFFNSAAVPVAAHRLGVK